MRRVKFTCVTQVHIIIIIIFFNYINTIELRQWSSQSIRRKRTNYIRNIKWKHIHKITVYTPKTITKMINTLYIYEVDTVCLFFSLFFFLASRTFNVHAWKCAYNLMWERINCLNGYLLNALLHTTCDTCTSSIDVRNVVKCICIVAAIAAAAAVAVK